MINQVKKISVLFLLVWEKDAFESNVEEMAIIMDLFDYTDAARKTINASELILQKLDSFTENSTEQEIQYEFYEIGKQVFGTTKEELRLFFRCLYTLLFQSQDGPRWGAFVRLTGVEFFKNLLRTKLENPLWV